MSKSHILGFPRIGSQRQMKFAVEAYWAQKIDFNALQAAGDAIRKDSWQRQHDAGLDLITVGDFSWYDHVLDTALMLGVVPGRFGKLPTDSQAQHDLMFQMARGYSENGADVNALQMTKWFNTNYHYLVPELKENQRFNLNGSKLLGDVQSAQAQGYAVKPVILGPLTFLWLSKNLSRKSKRLQLLDPLFDIYRELITVLKNMGVEWVQIDEPILALDLPQDWQAAFTRGYDQLKFDGIKILLTTYFNSLGDNAILTCRLPVAGFHVDLTHDRQMINLLSKMLPSEAILSAGIINGRNIWRNDLAASYHSLKKAKDRLHDRLWVSTSCSLMHVPIDVELESALDPEIKSWLAFAQQKILEVVSLNQALQHKQTADNHNPFKHENARLLSEKIRNAAVQDKVLTINESMLARQHDYARRREIQAARFQLPLFPTTTIGSFPQTREIRQIRKAYQDKAISAADYETQIRQQIQIVIQSQEEIGLDVLVHGEAERNDMVEYFSDFLQGFVATDQGWIQSYGSRCVKPPIIYGDIYREKAISVDWITYAQSLTSRPVKGMLTGPVTMLCWSFVRDDVPLDVVAQQMALALRAEILDLEKAGIGIIQIDEPAFREGLPLRHKDWPNYLTWAVNAFRLSTCGVKDETQIHSHMCYSQFNDVIESIAALDADVITIESARSKMKLLQAFEHYHYPAGLGPGVFDVHSPIIPSVEDMQALAEQAALVIPIEQLWVNPDCGLKTRQWTHVEQALKNMVDAAKAMRKLHGKDTS